MARPPKNAIHEASYQIKDFFNDESMKRIYPKNPYNVLWFMEEVLNKENMENTMWIDFKNYTLECLRKNSYVDFMKNPLKDRMIEDELVLKRIKNIIETSVVDINSLGLATKAVRMGSAPLIVGLLNMGLDPNKQDDINLPLEVALNRKNNKIAMVYWDHKKMDRFKLNKSGESYAEIAIKNKQWKFFEIILQDEPQMIYGTNEKNKLNVERLLTLFDGKQYKSHEWDKIVPERIKKIIVELIEFCDQKNGYIDISNPTIKKLWKEKMYKSFNEKFQEKPGKEKVRKLKI